jgi:hypothetical protein
MSYFRSITQNVVADAKNSFSGSLASNATYFGTGSSTLGIAGIQVSMKSDQSCDVYIDQSPDNVNWDIVDAYRYITSIGNFGITVQAINSYYRVRITNSGKLTGYVRMQTALCPIVEAVPRSLDVHGHMKIHTYGDEDKYGFEAENTPNGEKRMASPTRLIGSTFEGTVIDPNFWSTSSLNNATVSQSHAEITLNTGTTLNGSTTFYSTRRARYVTGNSMCYRTIINLSTGSVGNVRKWGIGYGTSLPTFTDGAYYELSGSVFSVATMRSGSVSKTSYGNFNGELGLEWEPLTGVKTYEIYWNNSHVWFTIDGELLHTHHAVNETWCDSMSPYIFMSDTNTGVSSRNYLYCRTASIRRLGSLLTQPTSKYQSGITSGIICKYGPGNLHSIVMSTVATSGAVLTIYDGTTTGGAVLSSFTFTWPAGGNFNPMSFDFKGLPFYNGLFFTIATQSANVLLIYE